MTSFFRILLIAIISVGAVTAHAATREEIDLYSQEALDELYAQSPAARELANRARAILVFPRVIKAGLVMGGEYGEGKLIVGGATSGYYSTASASIGFQAGAQRKAQVILFMTDDALQQFINADGWEAGVDGSVAVATFGTGGSIDSNTAQKPIIGFIFSNKGLMFNLTFEGSKMSKINR